jgi:hypothetical protein
MSAQKLHLQRSALEHHKQVGKELVPPFNQIGPPMEQVFWMRDLLPEFMWIDALVQMYGRTDSSRIFNDFLSAADPFNSHPREILDGTVGAFRYIPEERRQDFVSDHVEKIDRAVIRPFGNVLSLYAECPMKWMAREMAATQPPSTSGVKDAIRRLFPGKDSHAGFCRALPLNRFFAHQKVFITSDMKETIEAIEMYPYGDTYRAETFARTTHNMVLAHRAEEDQDTFAWSRVFWNSNYRISPCVYE